jgi:replicative DNA helicase
MWKNGILDLNSQKIKVLSFEFEMLAMDQVTRNISSNLNKSVSHLYSAENNVISDLEMEEINSQLKSIKNAPIYYVDDFCTVPEINECIGTFNRTEVNDDEALIVTIDHILLTKGLQGQNELHIVRDLYNMCINIKKMFDAANRKIIIFLVAQLNRNIEQTDRIVNAKLHYPNKSDIFGSSYAYYSSDYVVITHKPALIPGIKNYGPPVKINNKEFPKGLPIKDENGFFIYWHVIKNRSGKTGTLQMRDQLQYSKVVDN